MGMYIPIFIVINSPTVIETAGIDRSCGVKLGVSISRHGHSKVPKFHTLIFPVAKDISSITFAVDIRQTFDVTNESSSFSVIAHASPIPYFDRRIIGT
jgi:hypothetical protein